jgi:hypothetical protein
VGGIAGVADRGLDGEEEECSLEEEECSLEEEECSEEEDEECSLEECSIVSDSSILILLQSSQISPL